MMTVPSFSGMNPYLESPHRWPKMHTWLMVEIARSLNPQLLPKYRAAVETRVCIDSMPVGIPDASVYRAGDRTNPTTLTAVALTTKPEQVTLPIPLEVRERYLKMEGGQQADYQVVVSRANKRPTAERYGFNLLDRMPAFSLLLEKGADKPTVYLHQSLTNVCRETGIDAGIGYTVQSMPPLSSEDLAWVQFLS